MADPSPHHILLAQRDPNAAQALCEALAASGHTVAGPFCALGDCEGALDRLEGEGSAFDLALLDLELEGGLTFALARRLSRHGTRLAFTTARSDLVAEAGWPDAPCVTPAPGMEDIVPLLGSREP